MHTLSRFLQFEELTLQAATAYGRRPRAGDSTTPLYNTSLGKQPAKRRRTAEEAGSQQPGPSTGARGKIKSFNKPSERHGNAIKYTVSIYAQVTNYQY